MYLTPAQHAALRRAALASGSSMTEVIRGLVDRYLIGRAPPLTDLTDIPGLIQTGTPTDVATNRDQMLDEAVRDLR